MRSMLSFVLVALIGGALAAQAPTDPLLLKGKELLRRGNYEAAEKVFEQYIGAHPQDWRGYLGSAQSLARRRRLGPATERFLLAHQMNPTDPETIFDLASTLTNQYRFAEALPFWRRLEELAATDPSVAQRATIFFYLGQCASELEMTPEAIESFKKALQLDGESVVYREKLAAELFNAGRFRESRAELEELVRREPNNPTHNYHLGIACLQSADDEAAKEALTKAARLDAKKPEIHIELGKLYQRLRDVDRAYSHYFTATQLNPKSHVAWHALAKLAARKGHMEDAARFRDEYKKWHEVSRDTTEQMRTWRRRRLRDPEDLEAWFDPAMLYLREGRFDQAQRLLTGLLVHHPRHAQSILNLAALLAREGHLQTAAHEVQKLLDEDAGNPYACKEMGRLQLMMGRFAQAVPYLERSLKRLDRGAADVHRMLALCYGKVGDHQRSAAHLKRSQELDAGAGRQPPGDDGRDG